MLGEFSKSERKLLDEVIMDASEAIEDWIAEENIDKVMNRVNDPRRKKERR